MTACTIVIPCYNEADRLDLPAIVRYATTHDHRLLLVNDGSTDATGDILDDLVAADPDHLEALQLEQNRGKAEAVRQGVLHACRVQRDYVGYWDADLATPLEAIDEFVAYLQTHRHVNVLLGARVRLMGRQIERRTSRHCLGRLFATAAAATLRLPVYDTQCGAKLFRSSPRIDALFAEPFLTKWLFDVELLARYLCAEPAARTLSDARATIHELPLQQWSDVDGSKVKATDFLRATWQLAIIYRTYRRQSGIGQPSSVAGDGSPETSLPTDSRHATEARRHVEGEMVADLVETK